MPKIPQLDPIKTATGSIVTVENLCSVLDITLDELQEALSIPAEEKYTLKKIPKKDGTLRVVHNPHFRLRRIQRRINKRILSNQAVVSWPDHIFGSIPNQIDERKVSHGKDYVACARVHCESKSILTIDISNFFDNIHITRVAQIFRDFFKYSPEVVDVLANICCHNENLIQGALTSSYLATLSLFEVEGRVVDRMLKKQLRYTRLVDDINVSSRIASYNFDYAKALIEEMLLSMDLPVNNSKTRIQYNSTFPLTVHGLRVAFKEPRLPSDEVRKIRAAVHSVELMAREPQYRCSHPYRRDFNRCMGRVNKLSRVGHLQHSALVKRLSKIVPLPSQKDVERAIKIVAKLEADYPIKGSTFWYAKRYYLAHERLNVLQRSFPGISRDLRKRLKPIRSKYE